MVVWKPTTTNTSSKTYVTLLLGLILPKHSRTKKIAFGNKHYGVRKEKSSFFGHNDVEKIWCSKSEAFLPKYKVPTLKYEDGLMFWGCFSWKGTGQLISIRGIMKSEDHIKILNENLPLLVQNLDQGQQFTFQQDNDPKQASKSVTAWLQKRLVLPWS